MWIFASCIEHGQIWQTRYGLYPIHPRLYPHRGHFGLGVDERFGGDRYSPLASEWF
jgi:hypothetical protein